MGGTRHFLIYSNYVGGYLLIPRGVPWDGRAIQGVSTTMVVKCEICNKVVVFPDPDRVTSTSISVYNCLPFSCKCGKVKVNDKLTHIDADGDASVWSIVDDAWLPYVHKS